MKFAELCLVVCEQVVFVSLHKEILSFRIQRAWSFSDVHKFYWSPFRSMCCVRLFMKKPFLHIYGNDSKTVLNHLRSCNQNQRKTTYNNWYKIKAHVHTAATNKQPKKTSKSNKNLLKSIFSSFGIEIKSTNLYIIENKTVYSRQYNKFICMAELYLDCIVASIVCLLCFCHGIIAIYRGKKIKFKFEKKKNVFFCLFYNKLHQHIHLFLCGMESNQNRTTKSVCVHVP